MRVSATGAASSDDVWRRYVTPALWPTWAPQLRRVTCSDTIIRRGSTGTAHGPAIVRVPFDILSVDDVERTWSWRVGRPFGITMAHGVDDHEQGGATAWVEIPLALFAYAPIAHLALRRLVRP